jgi:hypothetical protein
VKEIGKRSARALVPFVRSARDRMERTPGIGVVVSVKVLQCCEHG